MQLKKAGIYIAVGDRTNVLIKVVGQAPVLEIVSGILLNDFYNVGKVTPLTKKSIELQDIIENPDKYIFQSPAITDSIEEENPFDGESTKGVPTDTELKEITELYKEHLAIYGNTTKFVVTMLQRGHSVSQTNVIITMIKKQLNHAGQ